MVTFYRVSRWGYNILGRWVVKTPHLSLVNILAGRRIIPELMPWHGSARQLTSMVMDSMDDLGYLYEVRQELLDVTDSLRGDGDSTASDNAARLVAEVLQNRPRIAGETP